jgi:hypothetical protein
MKYYGIIALVLTAVVSALFWAAHPVPKEFPYYFSNFAAAAALIMTYLALGIKILKILKISAGKMKYPFAFGLSLCAIGTIFFIAGFARAYNPYFAFAFLILTAAACYREIREIILDIAGWFKRLAGEKIRALHAVFYAAGGFAVIYLFMASLTPPVYYDTLVYHLALPGQYLQAGGMVNIRENIFSFFPQLMQMNCLFFLLISFELSVKILYFFMAIMSVVALAGLAGDMGADVKISSLLLLTCPLFFLNATRIGAELPLMYFTLLLIYALAGGGSAALAGIFAGAAMSVKYTGVLTCVFGAGLMVFLIIRKKARVRGLLLYLAVSAAVVLPYLIRNGFYTGDFLYPFFTGLFDMEAGLKMDAAAYVAHVAGFGAPHTLMNLFTTMVDCVARPGIYGGDAISPLFLLALLLLPLTDIKKTLLPALFIVYSYLTWFFTGQVVRFLLPVVPFAAAIAAQAYANTKFKIKYIAFGALIAAQACTALYFGEKFLTPFRLLVSDRPEYIRGNVSYFPAAGFLNTRAGRDGAVLVLGDARTLYIDRPALAYTVFNHRAILDNFAEMGEDKIMAGFKWYNIRYILINRTELERLKDGGYADVYALTGTEKFKFILGKYFEKTYSDPDCDIYAVRGRQ